MEYCIITGASRGLGNALCKRLASKDRTIFYIARSINIETMEELNLKCAAVEWLEMDLADYHSIETKLLNSLSKYKYAKNDRFLLVNNAAQIGPLGKLVDVNNAEMLDSISINLLAPLLLTKTVIKFGLSKKVPVLTINVSSPSAEAPKANWMIYGLAKNGINYVTKAVSKEYSKQDGIKIVSFYPGVMNTDMRKENLNARNIFKKILDWIIIKIFRQSDVKVSTADDAAKKLMKVITSTSLKCGSVIDSQKME